MVSIQALYLTIFPIIHIITAYGYQTAPLWLLNSRTLQGNHFLSPSVDPRELYFQYAHPRGAQLVLLMTPDMDFTVGRFVGFNDKLISNGDRATYSSLRN
jgi:hypothetical protein